MGALSSPLAHNGQSRTRLHSTHMPNSLPDKPRALKLLLQPPRRLSGQLKRLSYYLSSGFSRSVGSWSIKEQGDGPRARSWSSGARGRPPAARGRPAEQGAGDGPPAARGRPAEQGAGAAEPGDGPPAARGRPAEQGAGAAEPGDGPPAARGRPVEQGAGAAEPGDGPRRTRTAPGVVPLALSSSHVRFPSPLPC